MITPRFSCLSRLTTLSIVSAICMVGCDKSTAEKSAAKDAETIAVKTAASQTQSVDITVPVVGTLYGDEQTTVSPKVAGKVVKLYQDFGDRIDEGGKLAEIDRTEYELTVSQKEYALKESLSKLGLNDLPDDRLDVSTIATVQRTRVQSENAKAKLERARQLFEQKPPLISEQDFADIQTTYEVSRRDYDVSLLQANADLAAAKTKASDLAVAKQALTDTTILAPITGDKPIKLRFAVSKRYVNIGTYVKVADPMFDLVADDPIKFRAMVPEQYVDDVRVDQSVNLQMEGIKGDVIGKVSRINPTIDTTSRTFEVEALITNPDHRLRPGAFARASIIIGKQDQAIFVPKAAIISFAGTDKVFTITDGKAVEHRIEQGTIRNDYVQILSGMKSSEDVVIEGNSKLARGTPISVTTAPASAPSTVLSR